MNVDAPATLSKLLKGQLNEHFSLARYTSWRVGGKARRCYRPFDLADLSVFLKSMPLDENYLWLGLGSNILIRDGGFEGTVIMTQGRLAGLTQLPDGVIRAEAGVTCAKLAKFCARRGYEQSAFFAGIPGTIGGALAMNAGAYGGETWNHVIAVEMINKKGGIYRRSPLEFDISYRSVKHRQDEWFVAGYFRFNQGDTIKAEQAIRDLLKKRSQTQPIGNLSCGSVFFNPPGHYAAKLIDASGLKGERVGGASVSKKHANFIINEGSASANDIEMLIDKVADEVKRQQGVELAKEVHIVGR